MTNITGSDFLAEIEAEHHQHLLERGNLDKPRANPWHGNSNFLHQGYFTRVLRATCRNCGTQHDSLMGVFSREKNGLGAVREIALDLRRAQLPGGGIPREYEPVSVPACLECIP